MASNNEFLKRMNKLRDDMIDKPKKLNGRQQKEVFLAFDKAFQRAYKECIELNKLNVATSTLAAKVAFTNQLYNELSLIADKSSKDFRIMIRNQNTELMSLLTERIPDKKERDKFLKAFNKSVDINSKKALEAVIRGNIYKKSANDESIPLSDRLWKASLNASDKLNDAIQSCIAQGMSSTEMSKVIQEYGSGGHRTWDRKKIAEKLGPGYARKYSGGLDYEALRVARTTNTHIAQLAVIESSASNPYVTGVIWNSLHISGRTCAECISRDGQFFTLKEVPFDHPNGMCHLESAISFNGKTVPIGKLHENLDVAEAIGDDIGKWIRGEDNSGLMDKIPEYRDLPITKIKSKKQVQQDELPATKAFAEYARQSLDPMSAESDKEYRKLQRAAQAEWDEYIKKQHKELQSKYSKMTRKECEQEWLKLGIKKGSPEWDAYRRYVATGNSFRLNERLYSGEYIPGGKGRMDSEIDAFAKLVSKSKLQKNSQFVRFSGMSPINQILDKVDASWLNFDKYDEATAYYTWSDVKRSPTVRKHYMSMLNSQTVGKEFKFDSFTSVSYNKEDNLFTNREVIMEIYGQKGVEALYTENYSESELVFQKGTTFKILGFDMEGNKLKLILEAINK